MNTSSEKYLDSVNSEYIEKLSRNDLILLLKAELENSYFLTEEIKKLKKLLDKNGS